jgi:hypothetical protein
MGCEMEEALEAMPIHHHGYDKQGRPVLIQRVGKYDIDKLEKVNHCTFNCTLNHKASPPDVLRAPSPGHLSTELREIQHLA